MGKTEILEGSYVMVHDGPRHFPSKGPMLLREVQRRLVVDLVMDRLILTRSGLAREV